MDPQEELTGLLERVTEMALDNVDRYGYSVPLCLALSPAGERIYVVADAATFSPEDTSYDPGACVRSITRQVKSMIRRGQVRALALAEHVTCTLTTEDGKREKTPAVKVTVNHQAGGGYTSYVTYHLEEGGAVPGEIIHQAPEYTLFPPPG
jgi:hypothetical protein